MKNSPMNSRLDALCCGLNVVDILVCLPEIFTPGEKHQVDQLVVQGGAPAGNAACVIAALGSKTGYLAYFGDNTLSRIAKEELKRWNVRDDYFLYQSQAQPGVAVVEIDPKTGDRTVFYNLNHYQYLSSIDIPDQLSKKTKSILIDSYDPQGTLPLLEAAHRENIPSVLDLESGDPEILRKMISLGSDVILPYQAALKLTEKKNPIDAFKTLRQWTSATILITNGAHGSWAYTDSGIIHQPIFNFPVIDTTGCGDSYHGAYAFALIQDWPLPIRMEFAAWIAAIVAGFIGGRGDLPTLEKIRSRDQRMLSSELKEKILKL